MTPFRQAHPQKRSEEVYGSRIDLLLFVLGLLLILFMVVVVFPNVGVVAS